MYRCISALTTWHNRHTQRLMDWKALMFHSYIFLCVSVRRRKKCWLLHHGGRVNHGVVWGMIRQKAIWEQDTHSIWTHIHCEKECERRTHTDTNTESEIILVNSKQVTDENPTLYLLLNCIHCLHVCIMYISMYWNNASVCIQ